MEILRVLLFVLFAVFLLDHLPRGASSHSGSRRGTRGWPHLSFANFSEVINHYLYGGHTGNEILEKLLTERVSVRSYHPDQIQNLEELRRFCSVNDAVRVLTSEGHNVTNILQLMRTAIYVNHPPKSLYINTNNCVGEYTSGQSLEGSSSGISTNQEHDSASRGHESTFGAGTLSHTSSDRPFFEQGFIPANVVAPAFISTRDSNRGGSRELNDNVYAGSSVRDHPNVMSHRITNSDSNENVNRVRDSRTHEMGHEPEFHVSLRRLRVTPDPNAPVGGAASARLFRNRNLRYSVPRPRRTRRDHDTYSDTE